MLPEVKKVKLPDLNFPTVWQAVIFRNYGYISTDRLARLLETDAATVDREAARLGLGGIEYNPLWESLGYITVIRNNWFLLPYEQLIELLDITEERLDYILKNDDFLSVKLGSQKPECERVVYSHLSDVEITETERLARTVAENNRENTRAFDFVGHLESPTEPIVAPSDRRRILHGYLSPCGDPFTVDSSEYLPDALLAEYARRGVNGIWIHGLLSNLSPYPFKPSLSVGYEGRRERLSQLVSRAARYGIKIYIYLNEPRALPECDLLDEHRHLAGRVRDRMVSLCFSHEEVRDYLYGAVRDLVEAVPELGGFITIVMSENQTHCKYSRESDCPKCKDIPTDEIVAAINNTINRAMRDAGVKGELLANLWQWSGFHRRGEGDLYRGIKALDREIGVMCVSEFDLEIEKGGVKGRTGEYSISNVGPCQISIDSFRAATESGHRPLAKIQANNSWECSCVPYLPVFDLVYEHVRNLSTYGVSDFMLTWTLGGYPSVCLDMIAEFSRDPSGFSLDGWYGRTFGEFAERVHEAVQLICEGFRDYPFGHMLYFSAKNLGPANLWSLTPDEKKSTMVTFTFDDYEDWTRPYGYEIYTSLYESLLVKWHEGRKQLQALTDECEGEIGKIVAEMYRYAHTAEIHFTEDLLCARYSYLKRDLAANAEALREIFARDEDITRELIDLAAVDPKIGYEASCHYFYNSRNLVEKLIGLDRMREELRKI